MGAVILDHVVAVTPDLEGAARRYREAGFPVRTGGRHAGQPTRNELVPLADGAYLELLGGTRPWIPGALAALRRTPLWRPWLARRGPIPRRFLRLLAEAGGPSDLCFGTGDLAGAVARARAAGVELSDPIRMERTRPDGVRLAWRLAVPEDPFLPFLVEDETPRRDRVPSEPAEGEGVLARVRRLRVAVPDLARARRGFAALLGAEPVDEASDDLPPGAGGRWRGAQARFEVGGVVVRVVEEPGASLGRRLEVGVQLPGAAATAGAGWPGGIHVMAPVE